MVENIRDADLTIGTTSVLLAIEPAPGKRTTLIVTNTSAAGQVLNMGFGKAAIAGRGLQLYPGGTWSESMEGVFKPSNMAVQIISSAAGGTAAIHERVEGAF